MSGSNSFVKEMAIRKRVSNIFNKREEDFPSLKEYNDYLEEVEDLSYFFVIDLLPYMLNFDMCDNFILHNAPFLAFNLIEGIDVDEIEASIAKYQEENAEQIIMARARKAEELAAALKASKGPVQTETIDLGAGLSSQTAGTVLQGQYAPTALPSAGLMQPRPASMVPQPLPIGGPSNHPHGYIAEDEEEMKMRTGRAARAGGWAEDLSRKRSLEEAFNSIWI